MADNPVWARFLFSARIGCYELVTYFADMGIDIHHKTNDGINCLHIGACNGHFNFCKMLIDKHNFDFNIPDSRGWTALHYSVLNGSCKLFKYFSNMGADIHLKTNDGKNCLHIAALAGHLYLCKQLVEKHKIDVNMADNLGSTALHFSAQSGIYELFGYFAYMGAYIHLRRNDGINCLHIAASQGHLNLCKELIGKYRFDVNMADNLGWTALHCAAQSGIYELVTYFADMGTDINLKTNDGKNCLHIAAVAGHLDLCKMLIEKHKFDVNMADNLGSTALHFSVQSGSYELFRYFAYIEADIHLKTKDTMNCLHIAASKGHLNLCKEFIDKYKFDVNMTDKCGWTGLHFAATTGSCELVEYFADMGTDIHLETDDGMNCLHIAACQGHLNLCRVLIDKYKFDVNMVDSLGWVALHCSAQSGSYELVTYFADLGTNIHLKTIGGVNCLHIAANGGHLNLCKVLIDKHKFDINMTANCGWTALHFSVEKGSYELATYFVDMRTDIHRKANDGQNCLHIAALNGHFKLCKYFLEIHNFDVNMKDNLGWTALHYSVQSGNYELVIYIADMTADIHLKTSDGTNCLHIAALEGYLKLCKYFLEIHNFDVNMEDNEGWTSLHKSAKNGSFDVFSYILGEGSEIYCKTKNMKNVLHISAEHGHVDICKFVLKHFTKDYQENNSRNQHTLIGKSYTSQVFYKYNTIFLHAMDNDGNTYLHLATGGNQAKVCELLLKYDTEVITLLNKKDETAREIAEQKNHGEVLTLLKAEYDRAGMFFEVFVTLIQKRCYLVFSFPCISKNI